MATGEMSWSLSSRMVYAQGLYDHDEAELKQIVSRKAASTICHRNQRLNSDDYKHEQRSPTASIQLRSEKKCKDSLFDVADL